MENNKATISEEIQNIYTDVSEWLKFAEAKHAGLFAVWTALLISVISIEGYWSRITITKVALLVIIIGGILINLLSFIPFLNRCKWIRRQCYRKYCHYSDNSIFYQSIFVSVYSEPSLQDSVAKYSSILKARGLILSNTEFEKDYLKQIIEVSTIGTIKVYLFNIAVKYVVAVLVICLAAIIIA